MGTFQDQTAVVTGAATGIGRAIAAALAREGAQVALWDKDSTTLSETVEQLRSEGHRVTAHVVDVADRTSVIAAIAALHETFSTPVSLLVNNAIDAQPAGGNLGRSSQSFILVWQVGTAVRNAL